MRKKYKNGFTIVELLVVIAILGILSAIVLPKFIGQDVIAKKKKVLSDLASIDAALQLYNMDNGAWPVGATNLSFLSSSGYMATVPVPPVAESGFPVNETYYLFNITNPSTSYLVYRGAISYSGSWRNTSDAELLTW